VLQASGVTLMLAKEHTAQLLIFLGAILFFLGLISGFAIPAMTNPRMGLSGHLEGVMNGTFLIVAGLAWSRLLLPDWLARLALWSLIYGTFANWLFVTLAAIFGTSAMTPIASVDHTGSPWQESLVLFGLLSVGATMVIGCGVLVWGFFQKFLAEKRNDA
jgi:hydroxylaminobenzene mutase